MANLRLIGVDEDGQHLLLTDDDGTRHSVPLDDSLRTAVRRSNPMAAPASVGGGLRPKEVQAMIRAGLSTEEVAERAGWTVEKVGKFEGPILAEREHVAGLAQQARVRSRGAGSGAPTVSARVTERLRAREIDTDSTRWDSLRTDKGVWTVLLHFVAGGRQRLATWEFDPLARTMTARNDEARWLSDDEDTQSTGPLPAPHLAPPHSATHSTTSPGPSTVYDVEAEGGVGASGRRREPGTVDLMAAMRERSSARGRRRRSRGADVPGIERAPEEALPLEDLAVDPREIGPPPPAHERPTAAPDEPTPQDDDVTAGTIEDVPFEELDTTADDRDISLDEELGLDVELGLDDDLSSAKPEPAENPSTAQPTRSQRPARKASRKTGRASVPSWDDIMFGRKTES